MLNYNYLNNYRYWGEGLDKINHEMPYKHEDFRKSLNPNTMDAAIWLVEELLMLEDLPEELNITILNSWLGFPLVPLLCENLKVKQINLIDIDNDALELSKVFNRYYTETGVILNHINWDVPFAYHDINALETDVVISIGCEAMYPLKNMTTTNENCIFACQSSNVFREMYGINCVPTIEEHIENVNSEVMNLWVKGFINLDLFEKDPIITITPKALNKEEIQNLSKQERWSLFEIIRLLQRKI
jgi:hypothetical protein